MTAALIAAAVYLLGGYVMLALIAKFASGLYSEWELLGWCLMWPVSLVAGILVVLFVAWGASVAALRARWRRL